jgi:hypothetical protein
LFIKIQNHEIKKEKGKRKRKKRRPRSTPLITLGTPISIELWEIRSENGMSGLATTIPHQKYVNTTCTIQKKKKKRNPL